VTNRSGRAYLRAFNTECNDVTFQILSVELEEVDIISESQSCLSDSVLERSHRAT